MADKLTKYMLVISGLILIFYFFGLIDSSNSASAALLEFLKNPADISSTNFFKNMFGGSGVAASILGGLLAAGFIAGLAYRPDLTIFAAIIPTLISYTNDIIIVYNIVANVNEMLALIIFSPLILVLMLTIVEWWRGVST